MTPPEFLDFDLHPAESFSLLELVQYKAAWPVGGLFGAFVAILICAMAVRVLIGKWPKHWWNWALCVSLPTSISLALPIPFDSERMFLAIWYSLLGIAIGYWMYATSVETVEA
ncbi:MAG: hypothetical protein JSS69_02740 [Acidobacteria bacterium]|nr:hypothetical protein [Acidobacteriota bacterium]MBS1864812.1 hypothetical protein [Acidobacteriota bacterium]